VAQQPLATTGLACRTAETGSLASKTAGTRFVGTVTVATGIPDTADRRGVHIATLSAQSSAFGTVTRTLTLQLVYLDQIRCAKLGAVLIGFRSTGWRGDFGPMLMSAEGGGYTT